jgi:hypothetical protein
MNLWEGNTVPKFVSDVIWGSASHQTLFRNRIAGYLQPFAVSGSTTLWSNGNWPIGLEAWHRDFNFIGNVPGQTSVQNGYQAATVVDGSLVGATRYSWGNYDYFSASTRWDAQELPAGETAPADQTLPASLYRTSKPSWFGSVAWPPIGPDVSGMANKLPAQLCYETSNLGGGGGFDASKCY